MPAVTTTVEQATIRQYCKALRTPTIGLQFQSLADQAIREKHTYTRYLEALLAMEVEERERHAVARRIQEARLPRLKTIEDFDFSQSTVPATRIRELADGGYIGRAEPVVLIGECGTGKTHLATQSAVRRNAFDSQPRRPWSTNWSKPSIRTNSDACLPDGSVMN